MQYRLLFKLLFIRLPYTSAAVLEMFRHSTVIPAPTAREATEDFYFRGYLIRKGTAIVTNVHAVHFSESLWGDATNFRPERFLNDDGTGIDKSKADLLETFGAGKYKDKVLRKVAKQGTYHCF